MKLKKCSSQKTYSQYNKTRYLLLVALAIALAVSGILPNIAQANTYTVSNTNDSGAGSLRQAIDDANAHSNSHDTVEFSILVGSTILLDDELIITDSITIQGPVAGNSSSIILDAQGDHIDPLKRSRHINAGEFPSHSGQIITLENMTLKNGFFEGTSTVGGGSIIVNTDLNLNHMVISGNSTTGNHVKGGGLFSTDNTTLNKSIVSNNYTIGTHAKGGGIYVASGNVALNQSTLTGNFTTGSNASGGGIYVTGGNATFNQSTISDNSTAGILARGGGLFINNGYGSGNVTLYQSTFSGNESGSTGGGLYLHLTSATIIQSTIVNNKGFGGALSTDMLSANSGVTLINSILSDNFLDKNFDDRAPNPIGILKAINSIFGDPAIEITDPTSSDNIFTPPNLGPLQFNGGYTKTHEPNNNSPAINAGSNTEAAAFLDDQRGSKFQRFIDNNVDIGAVELQNISGNTVIPLPIGEVMTRRDMARIIVKERHPSGYTPPPATGLVYTDVKIGDINADWIEQLHAEGLTEGCAADVQLTTTRFCPDSVVMREDMAKTVFIGAIGIMNPQPNSNFVDVGSQTVINHIWINAAYENGGITQGCVMGKFCPKEPVTREWVDGDLLGEF